MSVLSQSIKTWPIQDRPREKILKINGEANVTDAELLAILLRTGTRGQSALDLAKALIQEFKTFRNLSKASTLQWQCFRGLGQAKRAQIKAALEIGRRFRDNETRAEGKALTSSLDAANIFMPLLRDAKIEIFKTIYLDGRQRILDIHDSSIGTINRAVPFIREIIRQGIDLGAAGLICGHNHPSGEVLPSEEDHKFTHELKEAGDLMRIKILDHIIIGNNKYYSFADQGTL
ncbi:MAG: DNA repair protein RadC [Candidatus Omnitrophica bacterium]|nr:DNA repair protein RadC [Candidatus Omnitrophota bacterium]